MEINFGNNQSKIEVFFSESGATELFSDTIASKEFIKGLDFHGFKGYLDRINGIILNLPKDQRGPTNVNVEFGNQKTGDVEFLPPHPDDKDMLLEEIFNAFKVLEDTEDSAVLLYLGIQIIHDYDNGNGRTGRSIFNLLMKNRPILEDRKTFSQKHVKPPGEVCALIYRELLKDLFGDAFSTKYGSFSTFLGSSYQKIENEDIPENIRVESSKIISENAKQYIPAQISFRDMVILKFLQTYRSLPLNDSPYYAVPYESSIDYGLDQGKKRFSIDGKSFINSLTENDCKKLISIHRKLKIILIRKLVDIYIKPNDYLVNGIPIKQLFIPNNKEF